MGLCLTLHRKNNNKFENIKETLNPKNIEVEQSFSRKENTKILLEDINLIKVNF